MEEAQRTGRPVEALEEDETDFDLLMEEEEEGAAYGDRDELDKRRHGSHPGAPSRSEERTAQRSDEHWGGYYDPESKRYNSEDRMRENKRRLDEESRRRPLSREEREEQNRLRTMLDRLPSKERAVKVGRDVMNELAKELGITFPGSEEEKKQEAQQRRPGTIPASDARRKVEAEAKTLEARDVSREATILERKLQRGEDQYGVHATHEKASWKKKEYKEYGRSRTEIEQQRKREALEAAAESQRFIDLRMQQIIAKARTAGGLQEAFILRTMLDSPVSRGGREGMRPRVRPSKGPSGKRPPGAS